MNALRALSPFARAAPRAPSRGPACDICAAPILERHRHLADLVERCLRCACDTCARLFVHPGAAGGRYRSVPERVLFDPSFTPSEAEWAALGIPVRLAFVFRTARAEGWTAVYPSPAGPTESRLPDGPWGAASGRTGLVQAVEPDVEALLLHGRPGATVECLLVPISACYELVATVRRLWKGFDGGDEVRREIDRCIAALRARRRPLPGRRAGGATP